MEGAHGRPAASVEEPLSFVHDPRDRRRSSRRRDVAGRDPGRGGGAARGALARRGSLVGSSPSADVVVHDATVSARHCALSRARRGVAIEDLGSRNGTFVGMARVREAWGRAGTAVTVGRSTLVRPCRRCARAHRRRRVSRSPGSPVPRSRCGAWPTRSGGSRGHALPVLVVGRERHRQGAHRPGAPPRRAQALAAVRRDQRHGAAARARRE